MRPYPRMSWVVQVPIWVMLIISPFLLMMWLTWFLIVASVWFIAEVSHAILWLFGAVRR